VTEATIDERGARPAVRLERVLVDPPEVVWRALTESDQLSRWFPCKIIVDGGEWRVGAKLEFPFPTEVIEMTLAGEILQVDAPHALAYTWGDETLRFELHEHGAGTRLVLVDELEPPHAARNAAGWDDCLDLLAGAARPGDAWQQRFARYAAAFTPALGPQEGPPPGYKGE
jgi:uncharacterized protein YndB with AHSA1/START domain